MHIQLPAARYWAPNLPNLDGISIRLPLADLYIESGITICFAARQIAIAIQIVLCAYGTTTPSLGTVLDPDEEFVTDNAEFAAPTQTNHQPYFTNGHDLHRSTQHPSRCTNLSCHFESYINQPIFRIRQFNFEPQEYLGQIRQDCPITRTWFFKDNLFGQPCWEHIEHNHRELQESFYHPIWRFTGDLLSDNELFYSPQTYTRLGGMLAVAATFAHTSIDEDFRNWMIRQELTEPNVDCWISGFGDGYYVVGTTTAVFALSRFWINRHGYGPIVQTTETWSYRTGRSLLVGAPTLLALQWLTGASRPGESTAGSEWKPFDDNNGVSGHAFVGAVPFLVAAKMSNRPVAKTAFFIGSGLAGYGRLCDEGHYLSQVLLGWSIAYLSVEATTMTDRSMARYRLVPLNFRGGHGLGIEVRR